MFKCGIFVMSFCLVIYVLYNAYKSENIVDNPKEVAIDKHYEIKKVKRVKDRSVICPIEDIFLTIHTKFCSVCNVTEKTKESKSATQVSATIIVLLLIASSVKSIIDVVKEKQSIQLDSDDNKKDIRRESLAEFANKKKYRKLSKRQDSIKDNLYKHKPPAIVEKREKIFKRANSSHTYSARVDSELDDVVRVVRPSGIETSTDINSNAPIGARPPPMLRRCSVPAMSLFETNSSGSRRLSALETDGDQTPDDKHKRIRILRRF